MKPPVALVVALLWTSTVLASEIDGVWQTEDGDGHIRIHECKNAEDGLCGKIVWLREPDEEDGTPRLDVRHKDPSRHSRPLVGLNILEEFPIEPDEDGVWRGRIYDPERGRTWKCHIRRDGHDRLKVRGFMGISLLGQTTRWTRLDTD